MNKQELIQHCKAFEQGYGEIGLLVYEKVKDNKAFRKTHKAILAQGEEGDQPLEYYDSSALNYLLSHILTDAKALKRMLREHEAFMRPIAVEVLSSMIEHPAYWCFFSVEEILDDDLFTIEDLLTEQRHLLYSPRLTELQSHPDIKGKHFLTLVYSNGECLHCAGILRFSALPVSDLHFYCSLFHHGPDAALDATMLREVINKHYLEFFKLDTIGHAPEPKRGSQTLKQMWLPFTLHEFDIADLGGSWDVVTLGNQVKYNMTEPDETMWLLPHGELLFSEFLVLEGMLVRDSKTGAMGLSTSTDTAYIFNTALLERSYPNLCLPEKPSISLSVPLASLLMVMDIEVPWSHFKKILFTPNQAVKELLYGKDSYTVPPDDKTYELPDCPLPSPAQQNLFIRPLAASPLFVFDDGPETRSAFNALTGDKFKEACSSVGLLTCIEHGFIEHFTHEKLAYYLVNHCFWLLFHTGKDWTNVRSYAIEMLKLMPAIILEYYEKPEHFISDFSLFTKKFLLSRGICTLKARPFAYEVDYGWYHIKGSEAFYSLVEGVNG